MTRILSNRGKLVLLLFNCFVCKMKKYTKKIRFQIHQKYIQTDEVTCIQGTIYVFELLYWLESYASFKEKWVTVNTRQNLADFVPTSNLVYIKEVAFRTTFCHMIKISGIIYYTCSLVIEINVIVTKIPSTNVFNELCVKMTRPRSNTKKVPTVSNVVYFRLCIDLMHILPPVAAERWWLLPSPDVRRMLRSCYYNVT